MLAMGHVHNDLELPSWAMEILSRMRESEVKMVSGEWTFQATVLFLTDNWRQIVQNSQGLQDLIGQWQEVRDLQGMLRE